MIGMGGREQCPYCSTMSSFAIHPVGSDRCCVKAIEYHPNGTVKRVEYKDPRSRVEQR